MKTLKEVFKKPRYILISLITMIFFYSLAMIFANFKIILAQDIPTTIKNLPLLLINYSGLLLQRFVIGLIITDLLVGVLFAFIFYKINMVKSASGKTGFFASMGVFFGVIAPACPSCGIGLLAFLGITSAVLAFLPLKGFEFVILSVLFLSFSIYKASIAINNGIVCEIKTDKRRLKGGKIKNE
jgi:hypothetical protein